MPEKLRQPTTRPTTQATAQATAQATTQATTQARTAGTAVPLSKVKQPESSVPKLRASALPQGRRPPVVAPKDDVDDVDDELDDLDVEDEVEVDVVDA